MSSQSLGDEDGQRKRPRVTDQDMLQEASTFNAKEGLGGEPLLLDLDDMLEQRRLLWATVKEYRKKLTTEEETNRKLEARERLSQDVIAAILAAWDSLLSDLNRAAATGVMDVAGEGGVSTDPDGDVRMEHGEGAHVSFEKGKIGSSRALPELWELLEAEVEEKGKAEEEEEDEDDEEGRKGNTARTNVHPFRSSRLIDSAEEEGRPVDMGPLPVFVPSAADSSSSSSSSSSASASASASAAAAPAAGKPGPAGARLRKKESKIQQRKERKQWWEQTVGVRVRMAKGLLARVIRGRGATRLSQAGGPEECLGGGMLQNGISQDGLADLKESAEKVADDASSESSLFLSSSSSSESEDEEQETAKEGGQEAGDGGTGQKAGVKSQRGRKGKNKGKKPQKKKNPRQRSSRKLLEAVEKENDKLKEKVQVLEADVEIYKRQAAALKIRVVEGGELDGTALRDALMGDRYFPTLSPMPDGRLPSGSPRGIGLFRQVSEARSIPQHKGGGDWAATSGLTGKSSAGRSEDERGVSNGASVFFGGGGDVPMFDGAVFGAEAGIVWRGISGAQRERERDAEMGGLREELATVKGHLTEKEKFLKETLKEKAELQKTLMDKQLTEGAFEVNVRKTGTFMELEKRLLEMETRKENAERRLAELSQRVFSTPSFPKDIKLRHNDEDRSLLDRCGQAQWAIRVSRLEHELFEEKGFVELMKQRVAALQQHVSTVDEAARADESRILELQKQLKEAREKSGVEIQQAIQNLRILETARGRENTFMRMRLQKYQQLVECFLADMKVQPGAAQFYDQLRLKHKEVFAGGSYGIVSSEPLETLIFPEVVGLVEILCSNTTDLDQELHPQNSTTAGTEQESAASTLKGKFEALKQITGQRSADIENTSHSAETLRNLARQILQEKTAVESHLESLSAKVAMIRAEAEAGKKSQIATDEEYTNVEKLLVKNKKDAREKIKKLEDDVRQAREALLKREALETLAAKREDLAKSAEAAAERAQAQLQKTLQGVAGALGKFAQRVTVSEEARAAEVLLRQQAERQRTEALKTLDEKSTEVSGLHDKLRNTVAMMDELNDTIARGNADKANYQAETSGLRAALDEAHEETEKQRQKVQAALERQSSAASASASPSGAEKKEMQELKEELRLVWGALKCTVCKKNSKNKVITTCGHAFCNECLDKQEKNRDRKCGMCKKAWLARDVHPLNLQA
uniref:E3 ubiquitin protein ligase n=1 Tax=Chromera velia CCMP2878 TaxID=1169474 RepID=A0A0G4GWN1_9ALVE|eukprot:Cvel_5303.t1-p1 / transcript=Cvel_5303.t1 / gene=Cvel_5303 / organism=Chromera_velia_CCMP2878 / gene_product=E3 ubiquitin-protein ligase bre-1, putative / transcript_product=E3 ubiquitin-protein ligase bre-1, putative / location=Cvel_scaffold245:77706-90591(-) / protein_length=1209 / sequence_SO=supercontig / SO=protein_coding / is_pseudo=false